MLQVKEVIMKRLLCVLALMLCLPLMGVSASEYTHFQTLYFQKSGVTLLRDFSDFTMKRSLNRIDDTRFWGWITEPVTNHEKVYFTKETVLLIDNLGTTPIKQSYTLKVSEQSKIQYDARGQISTRIKGKVKGFDLNLDAKLNLSYTNESVKTIQEETKIDIQVDPQTALKVAIYGEGYISNGVAKYFRFFRSVREGGYEYFVLSTEYYGIEKVPIS